LSIIKRLSKERLSYNKRITMSIFHIFSKKKTLIISELGEFIISRKEVRSVASRKISNELGNFNLTFTLYDSAVTKYQLDLYHKIKNDWPGIAATLNTGHDSKEPIILEAVVIRDADDKRSDILCEVYTNTVVLEFEKGNALFSNI
tara:strand:- start:21680 stop:22117 length:438 start_codon:yes stop_codon:yes gene_type:complete